MLAAVQLDLITIKSNHGLHTRVIYGVPSSQSMNQINITTISST